MKHDHREDPSLLTVYTDDRGQHMIMLPGGIDLPAVLSTCTIDTVEEDSTVYITAVCNIAKDREAALKIYSK